jgi:hypothetical protein
MFGANEKLRGKRRCVSQFEPAAIDNYKSAKFAGFVMDVGNRFCGRQKNSADEHDQTYDGRSVTAPSAKRENYHRGSGDSQENAKEHPRARVAARMQDLGDEQHQGKQNSNGNMTQPLAETFLSGKHGIGCGAHL